MKDILKDIKDRFHKDISEATLVGTLSRKVKANDTFYLAEPSIYGLLEWKKTQTKVG